jgi:hypothetical protein
MSLLNKKEVARALLLRGIVFIHLDPRRVGVIIPNHLKQQYQVVLLFGLDMPVPIPDLKVDDEGVVGTLSFKGAPFTCTIPWASVFAIVGEDAKGIVWNEDMPAEVAAEVKRERDKTSTLLVSKVVQLNAHKKALRPAGTVKSVGNIDGQHRLPALAGTAKRGKTNGRTNHLRVVK